MTKLRRVQALAIVLLGVEAALARTFGSYDANSGSETSFERGGRAALAAKDDHLSTFLVRWGLEDAPEVKPDHGLDKNRFFERSAAAVIGTHDAQQRARQRHRERHLADRRKYVNATGEGAALAEREEPGTKEASEFEAGAATAAAAAVFVAARGANGRESAADVTPESQQQKRPRASVRKRIPKRKVGSANVSAVEGCKIFVLDLASIAEKEGIPQCDVRKFAAHPLTQRLLPDPLRADPGAARELESPPDTLQWTYPFTSWPHHRSQNGAPWLLQQSVLGSSYSTSNASEATVVLVDDYCYLAWAIADLHAQGHWWLDMHKHYKADPKARQHLLEVYHAMAHTQSFMAKQGRNFLFVAPMTSFDFGDWKTMDDYVAMSCEHFSNSMHIVFDQAQRWRCGRYRPERTLVAPLSVTDSVAPSPPPPAARRNLTAVFRGSCDPDGGKDPRVAGKRLRRNLARLAARSGPDVAIYCTNEDKTGLGPDEAAAHRMLSHADFMHEMGSAKFCLMLPGETQNTPRITEAFLAGCVPVFVGPPWHAMPYPATVDYRASAVTIHISDVSRWADFGSKWVLEKNAPRDRSRLHPRWWTPQVSAKDMDELHALSDVVEFLRDYPEELYMEKQAAVRKYRAAFLWAGELGGGTPQAADVALEQICAWGRQESAITHLDI